MRLVTDCIQIDPNGLIWTLYMRSHSQGSILKTSTRVNMIRPVDASHIITPRDYIPRDIGRQTASINMIYTLASCDGLVRFPCS